VRRVVSATFVGLAVPGKNGADVDRSSELCVSCRLLAANAADPASSSLYERLSLVMETPGVWRLLGVDPILVLVLGLLARLGDGAGAAFVVSEAVDVSGEAGAAVVDCADLFGPLGVATAVASVRAVGGSVSPNMPEQECAIQLGASVTKYESMAKFGLY
jgi:hypothetical protein